MGGLVLGHEHSLTARRELAYDYLLGEEFILVRILAGTGLYVVADNYAVDAYTRGATSSHVSPRCSDSVAITTINTRNAGHCR